LPRHRAAKSRQAAVLLVFVPPSGL